MVGFIGEKEMKGIMVESSIPIHCVEATVKDRDSSRVVGVVIELGGGSAVVCTRGGRYECYLGYRRLGSEEVPLGTREFAESLGVEV